MAISSQRFRYAAFAHPLAPAQTEDERADGIARAGPDEKKALTLRASRADLPLRSFAGILSP